MRRSCFVQRRHACPAGKIKLHDKVAQAQREVDLAAQRVDIARDELDVAGEGVDVAQRRLELARETREEDRQDADAVGDEDDRDAG